MAQLRQDYQKFVERQAEVVVVGPDSREAFKKYWQDNDLPFIGLPNPSHSVLKQFGQEVKIFKFGRMPAQAVIDKAGKVRFIHYGKSMQDIPDTGEILARLDELNAEHEQQGHAHERAY